MLFVKGEERIVGIYFFIVIGCTVFGRGWQGCRACLMWGQGILLTTLMYDSMCLSGGIKWFLNI